MFVNFMALCWWKILFVCTYITQSTAYKKGLFWPYIFLVMELVTGSSDKINWQNMPDHSSKKSYILSYEAIYMYFDIATLATSDCALSP